MNAKPFFKHGKQPITTWEELSKQKERRRELHKLPVFPGNSTGPIHLKAGLRPRSSVT